MRWREKGWLLLLLLAGGLAGFTALWSSARTGNDGSLPAFGGVYIEGIAGAPSRVNPLFAAENEADAALAALVFAGLTRLDDRGRAVPDLAQPWEVSLDGRSYTFRLRSGLVWHDGAPLSVDDVLFTYGLARDASLRSRPPLAMALQGAVLTRVDAQTLTIELPRANASLAAHLTLGILPRHLLDGLAIDALGEATFNQRPVGSGPYRLEEISRDRALLSGSPAFHAGQPFIRRIEMRFYRDEGALLAALKAREVEGAFFRGGVSADDIDYLERRKDLRLSTLMTPDLTQVFLNLRRPVFQDARVRAALYLALDRDQLAAAHQPGACQAADSPLPPGTWMHVPSLAGTSPAPAAAAALLDAAGWRLDAAGRRAREGGVLSFTLSTNSDPVRGAVAAAIAAQWRALGISVAVETPGMTSVVRELIEPRSFDALLFAFRGGQDPDPFPLWHSSGERNLGSFSDERLDSVVEASREAATPAQRADALRAFQEIYVSLMPTLPLCFATSLYVQPAALRGAKTGFLADAGHRFWQVQDWFVRTR